MNAENAQELGRMAEDRAAEYLVSLGWTVLARNVRNNYGELDIVAADSDELVIVEVRARSDVKVQGPIESIDRRKLRALVRSSKEYMENLGWSGFWRIDVVGITLGDKKAPGDWELEHVRDITAGMNILC
ncbi:MAG: YraN family protein [Synergistaceae bacterium]|nr:YraN family protein [Synergistaceae bacterium]